MFVKSAEFNASTSSIKIKYFIVLICSFISIILCLQAVPKLRDSEGLSIVYSCSDSQRSASIAALQPDPAAVTACLYVGS
jgi:hypothetical protein